MSLPYDSYYYARCCGLPYERNHHWLTFFDHIAERIHREIAPRSVLDVGCAFGFLVERLRARGIEAYGIDISEHAIQNSEDTIRQYLSVASVTESFTSRYDLIVCIEVLEHLSPTDARIAIENICAHTDDVLFSSTPFDYREPTHINVHPPGYWIEQFAEQGLVLDDGFDATFICPWAFRCRRTKDPLYKAIGKLGERIWHFSYQNQELRQALIAKESEVRSTLAERDALRRQLDAALAEQDALRHRLDAALAHQDQSELDYQQHNKEVFHLLQTHLQQTVRHRGLLGRLGRWLSITEIRPLALPFKDILVSRDHWLCISDDPQVMLLGAPLGWLDPVYVEVTAAGDGGQVCLYVDAGEGFREESKYVLGVLSREKQAFGAWVRPGAQWRLDPSDHPGRLQLLDIRLRHINVIDLLRYLRRSRPGEIFALMREAVKLRSVSVALLTWLRARGHV